MARDELCSCSAVRPWAADCSRTCRRQAARRSRKYSGLRACRSLIQALAACSDSACPLSSRRCTHREVAARLLSADAAAGKRDALVGQRCEQSRGGGGGTRQPLFRRGGRGVSGRGKQTHSLAPTVPEWRNWETARPPVVATICDHKIQNPGTVFARTRGSKRCAACAARPQGVPAQAERLRPARDEADRENVRSAKIVRCMAGG